MKALLCLMAVMGVGLSSCAVIRRWHTSADGSLYFIEPEQKYNWFEAWNECARKNLSLVAIDAYDRHSQIDTLIKSLYPTKCPPFWLGGHDHAVDKRYEWASTGEVFTFTNWSSGEPSLQPSEHCILIYVMWDWHDAACFRKSGFICEENRLLKAKPQEMGTQKRPAQDEDQAMAKTFIWRNYNVNFGQNTK